MILKYVIVELDSHRCDLLLQVAETPNISIIVKTSITLKPLNLKVRHDKRNQIGKTFGLNNLGPDELYAAFDFLLFLLNILLHQRFENSLLPCHQLLLFQIQPFLLFLQTLQLILIRLLNFVSFEECLNSSQFEINRPIEMLEISSG